MMLRNLLHGAALSAVVLVLVAVTPVSFRSFAQVGEQELTVVNPTSKAKLWAKVFFPAGGRAERKYPAVVMVPGGLGFGSAAANTPEPRALADAGLVVGYFDPDGRGRSEGKEDYNGKVHQEGMHAFLKQIAGLPQVDKDNLGVVSSSLGLAMAAGALGRYPNDPPVKYFIDIEGPSDRFYITKFDDPRFLRVFGHTSREEEWWAEREAVRSIKQVRSAYLRIQTERDHVHAENKQHALDMINTATDTKFGGQGKSAWTRINGPENEPNRTYSKDNPPKWLTVRAGPPSPDERLRWVREMAGIEATRAAAGEQPVGEVRIRFVGTGHPDIVSAKPRMQAGIVVDVASDRWLFDAGAGVLARLYDNKLSPETLSHIFVSHLHYDHCLDLAAILLLWQTGGPLPGAAGPIPERRPLILWGPDGLEKMLSDLYELAYGADGRGRRLLSSPLLKKVRNRDVGVYEGKGYKTSFRQVKHHPGMDCWAVRLETPKGVIVYSGDLGSPDFPRAEDNTDFSTWARDADMLIIDTLHLAPEELAKVAAAAKPKTLVLSHLSERFIPAFRHYDLRKTVELCAKVVSKVVVAEEGLELKP